MQADDDNNGGNDNNIPPPPPPPAPYVLTGFEDGGDDYLTSASLQRVALQKAPAQAKPEPQLGALSALELAVRRRAAKKVDEGLLERARACVKQVDDIRFEKTLLAQAQIVQEAKRLEQLLEEQGGPEAAKSVDWPTFDVASLDALLKKDIEVHNVIVSAKKVLQEQQADQVEALLMQLQGVQQNIDYLRRCNTERYQLRLRVDAQQEAKSKYAILLLQMLFESGFRRSEELQKTAKSKFGSQFQSQKALSFLKAAVLMSKRLNSLIKAASDGEKQLIEQMLKRALDVLEGRTLTRSSSGGSLTSSTSPEKVAELSEEDANALMSTATGKVLEALLGRGDVRVSDVSSSTGSTPLHSVASVDALLQMLDKPDALKGLSVKAKDSGDLPLHSLCKRAAVFKKDPRFADVVVRLISMAPSTITEGDSAGRKPLSSLALRLARNEAASAAESGGNWSASHGSSFERFLFSPVLSDVSFVLDSGAEVAAHRIILSAGSSVLRALLEDSQFAEARSQRIALPEVEEETLRFVFRFLYAGPSQAQILLSQEPLGVLAMKLADRWLVVDLVRLLAWRLLKLLSRENCFLTLQETESMSSAADVVKTLRRAAASFILNEYDVLQPYDEDQSKLREAVALLAAQE